MKKTASRDRAEAKKPSARAREARRGGIAWLVPAACVLLAFVSRWLVLSRQPWVTVDGTEYIRFAESLMRGQAFPSIFPPGYPVLIALARFVLVDRVISAEAVSLVCGALLPWPTWLLARRAVGQRWAIVPTLVVALHPALVLYSDVTLSESAYLVALYAALALAAATRALPAGLAIGAAFAIRPEALVPALALAARDALRGRAHARPLALGSLGFLLLAIPCWFYFHATLGQWTLTPKVAAAVREQGASWREEERRMGAAAPERYSLGQRLVRYGPEALRRYPANALQYARWLHHLWPAPLLLLSIWGFARRRGIESLALLTMTILPFVSIAVQARFLLSAIPALAILATIPIAGATRRGVRLALAIVALAGVAWCAILNGPDLFAPFDGYVAAHQEAGEWLGGVAEPDAIVMDRKPYVAFYAERRYWVTPDLPYDQLIDTAIRDRVRYLVIDENVTRVFRPQLLPLIHDPKARDRESRLEMVYAGGHFKGWGIGIFRVLRPREKKSGRPPEFRVRWMRGRA